METETLQVCAICGAEFENCELTEIANGDLLCDDCLNENDYYACEECGEVHHIDDMYSTDYGMYCEECFNQEFITCERCGDYERRVDAYIDDNYELCYRCYHNYYFTCDDCGAICSDDERHTSNGYEYCEDCYHYNCKVKRYGYLPALNFLKEQDENTNLYFGFELEVEGDEDYADSFLDHFAPDEREIFLTEDSSLDDGFEITSQPMTYNYFKKSFETRFKNSLNFLECRGFESHNVGGLHVHTSRKAWTNNQLAHLCEIMYGNDNDINTWLKITQRKAEKLQEWASMRNKEKSFEEIQDGYAPNYGRYTAVNYTGNTIEFRIFNGNLKIERFLKNLECVKALYDYTKEIDEAQITSPYADTTDFLKFVLLNRKEYPNLTQFINDNNIFIQHLQGAEPEKTVVIKLVA